MFADLSLFSSLDKDELKALTAHVGSSREMISRILKDLRTGNYIEVHDKQITINQSLPSHW